MCKFFEVSRSGYYAYLKRKDTPDRDLPLAEKIREFDLKLKFDREKLAYEKSKTKKDQALKSKQISKTNKTAK